MSKASDVMAWIDDRIPLTATWNKHVGQYYAPKNFNFWYYFGSLALLVLVIQIVTGIFLTMNYKPDGRSLYGLPVAMGADVVLGCAGNHLIVWRNSRGW